jgi:hypothetical protein
MDDIISHLNHIRQLMHGISTASTKVSGRLPGPDLMDMGCQGPGFHPHEHFASAGGQGLASTVQSRMAEAECAESDKAEIRLY